MRKNVYLLLTILGTILPNIFVLMETIETGNVLFYARPLDTLQQMFATNVSSAFVTDLLFVVLIFMIWSFVESRRNNIKGVILIWIYTFAFGIAGGLPLYLLKREKNKLPAFI